jgi:Pilus formation protein N terminal region
MMALCTRVQAGLRPLYRLSAILLLLALVAPATAADPIVVFLDQAKIIQLPERASTVVIGNPLIADLTIQPGGLAVITGKGYGSTNFVALDRHGAVLAEHTVAVQGPSDPTVVVYRGPTRQTYSCTPDCSPRITLGDTAKDDFDKETQLYTDFFAKTINQSATRNSQATSAGAPAAAR